MEVEKIVLDEGKLHFRESGSAILHEASDEKAGLSIVSTHGHVRIENITFSKNNISGLSSLLISNSIENFNTLKKHKLLAVRGADKSNHFSVESDGKVHAPKIAGGVQIYGANKDSDVLKLNDSVEGVRRSSKMFQVNSISTYIENPMSLDVPNMTGGKGFRIVSPSITSGSALQITTLNGNNMKGRMAPISVKIWKDGTVTVDKISAKRNLTNGEFVRLANCTVESNSREYVVTMLENVMRRLTCTKLSSRITLYMVS